MAWYRTGGGGANTSEVNATASDVLSPKKIVDANGNVITGTILSKSAENFIHSTADQTIPAGKYLSGNQVIKGDPNFLAGNIKKGVTLFGVTGTFEGYVAPEGYIYYNGAWGEGYSENNIVPLQFETQTWNVTFEQGFIRAPHNGYDMSHHYYLGLLLIDVPIAFLTETQRVVISFDNFYGMPGDFRAFVVKDRPVADPYYTHNNFGIATKDGRVDTLYINNVEVLHDGYTVQKIKSMSAYGPYTITIAPNSAFTGYVALVPTTRSNACTKIISIKLE